MFVYMCDMCVIFPLRKLLLEIPLPFLNSLLRYMCVCVYVFVCEFSTEEAVIGSVAALTEFSPQVCVCMCICVICV